MEERLREIEEELDRLRDQDRRRDGLDRKLKDLRSQQQERQKQEAECARSLARERADVEELERHGLKSLLARLSGDWEERLSRERREEMEAAVRWEQARRDLEYIDGQIHDLLVERKKLEEASGRMEDLWREKETLLKGAGGPVGRELAELSERLAALAGQRREVDEALAAGQSAEEALSGVLQELDDAGDLGVWDILGGGMLVTMAKHEHIDEARAGIDRAQRAMSRFRTELADVCVGDMPQVQIGEFATFADYFFDGLFADWAVQSGIREAQANVEEAYGRVRDALVRLRTLGRDLEEQSASLERRRDELVKRP